jgi:UDP-3-O-[3-hydroxymyristoyl] glucosamine N-acyltransferase
VTTTVRQLADHVRGELLGDGDLSIASARTLSEAGPHDITFVEGDKHLHAWHESKAGAAIVPLNVPVNGRPIIRVADPLAAFAAVVVAFRGSRAPAATGRIDPASSVHPTAKIGPGTTVGPFAVIGEGVVVGANCVIHAGVSVGRFCTLGDGVLLHPHVAIYDDCKLGDRVTVHANAVIGADGFGYRTQQGKHTKVPQLGTVEIGDDVEIGACTTIDRGTFGPTRIGAGTKIDNLVMIAHNCQIGRGNLLVSQVGIAGSSTTGDFVVMAGQVGVGDHVDIGSGSVIGAKSGVPKDLPAGSKVLGAPARPDRDEIRILMSLEKLPQLRKDVQQIKKKLGLEDAA